VEAANGQSTIEEKLEERLDQDKSPGAMDKTSNETSRASKEARKGGGREKRKKDRRRFHYLWPASSATSKSREGVFISVRLLTWT
jgi:hypothetical protein